MIKKNSFNLVLNLFFLWFIVIIFFFSIFYDNSVREARGEERPGACSQAQGGGGDCCGSGRGHGWLRLPRET